MCTSLFVAAPAMLQTVSSSLRCVAGVTEGVFTIIIVGVVTIAEIMFSLVHARIGDLQAHKRHAVGAIVTSCLPGAHRLLGVANEFLMRVGQITDDTDKSVSFSLSANFTLVLASASVALIHARNINKPKSPTNLWLHVASICCMGLQLVVFKIGVEGILGAFYTHTQNMNIVWTNQDCAPTF